MCSIRFLGIVLLRSEKHPFDGSVRQMTALKFLFIWPLMNFTHWVDSWPFCGTQKIWILASCQQLQYKKSMGVDPKIKASQSSFLTLFYCRSCQWSRRLHQPKQKESFTFPRPFEVTLPTGILVSPKVARASREICQSQSGGRSSRRPTRRRGRHPFG